MKILAIETSCDETGVSVLEAKMTSGKASFEVLATSLASQIKIHAPYGGVYPMLAKREHIKNLPILLKRVLKKAKLENKKRPVDLVIVTSGPGLEPALWTGIVFAKELAESWQVPLMPSNHMEGHILSVFAKNKGKFDIGKIKFPILSLLVSGGHTELVLTKDWLKYNVIGQTLDDAAGEAYDKVARMLELPYPGGPEISKLAEQSRSSRYEQDSGFKLPRPMLHSKNFDFSFSGLKTAVLYLLRDLKKINPDVLNDQKIKKQIALEFENAVVETLVHKTKKAIEKYKIETLIVAGGVSANKHLQREIRKMLKKNYKNTTLFFPEKKLTGDNSVMIGVAGYLEFMKNKGKVPKLKNIKAEGNLRLK